MTDRSAPLDGLRALAVMAVLLYHAHYGWAVGGYLGVDVFFVLSGYLITRVLLSTQRSWWGYRQFLVRRTARLAPALVVAVAGMTVVGLLMGVPPAQVGRCGAASAGYLMNLSSVAQWHCPPMWHVTWSLAAEQQFYLVWPLALAGLALASRRLWSEGGVGRRRGRVLAAAACLLVLGGELLRQLAVRQSGDVAAVRGVLFAPGSRSLVLLLGCAVALVEVRGVALQPRRRQWFLSVGAMGGVAVLIGCVTTARLDDTPAGLLPFLVAGVASAVVIVTLRLSPSSWPAQVLGAAPVAWLGRASYSLYLWHEVAYRLAETVAPRGSLTAETLRFVLALGLAAASYGWVELPAQRWWRSRERQRVSDGAVVAGGVPTATTRTPHPPPSPHPQPAALLSTPGAPR